MDDEGMSTSPRAGDDHLPRSPVFVLGSPRSGTTILANSLRRAGYNGFNEGHLLSLLVPLKDAINQHFIECNANDNDQLLSNLDRRELIQEIFQVVQRNQSLLNPSGPWFDKTPDASMIRAAPAIAQLWPSARFIFAKRRGMENITSRLNKFPATPFEEHCRYWSESMTVWRAVRDTGLRYIEVDQFDVAHNPLEVTARVGKFLSLSEDSMDEILAEMVTSQPERTDETSARRVLSIENCVWSLSQIEAFRDLCGAEMKHYEYTFDENYRVDRSA